MTRESIPTPAAPEPPPLDANVSESISWHHLANEFREFLAVVNREGMVIYTNHPESGSATEEIFGAVLHDILPAAHHRKMDFFLEEAFLSGRSQSYRVSIPESDPAAAPRHFEVSVRPVARMGYVDLAIVLIMDITLLHREEELLRQLERRLKNQLEQVDHPDDVVQICAWTKRIRRGGEWVSMEEFLRKHLGLRISHGISDQSLLDG